MQHLGISRLRSALLLLWLIAGISSAQTTGEVDFKYLGISFTIPEGWVGQEFDGGYLMGSHTEPGLVRTRHGCTGICPRHRPQGEADNTHRSRQAG